MGQISVPDEPDAQRAGELEPTHSAPELHSVPSRAVELRRQVPAVPTEVAGLRHAVLAFAAGLGFDESARGDIGLAVSEACTNVVVHAYRDAADPGPMTVEAYHENRELVVTVSDEGTGFAPRPDSPGLGLGLGLMSRLTSRMEIGSNQPRGSTIVMAFG
jgi:serine/threonine-protein kinase RsbW